MAEHKVADPVLAIPCWGIFADYDGNAPDTAVFFHVATEELAREVCAVLNEDPRSWVALGFVEGCEYAKSYECRGAYVAPNMVGEVFTSLEALRESEHFERDEDSDGGEDSDG